MSGKGSWEFHVCLSHASSFWAEHMVSLNKNMDSSRKKMGISIWRKLMLHAVGTFVLNIIKLSFA